MASQRVFELADELTGGDIAIDLDLDWLLLRMHVDGLPTGIVLVGATELIRLANALRQAVGRGVVSRGPSSRQGE
jgi:hypothetical protein